LRTESVEKWSPDFKSSRLIRIIIILVALVVWKEGFESFDDQNLFLLQITGIIANEPIPHVSNVSGLLSKVRVDR
jgi:hypothetical protein